MARKHLVFHTSCISQHTQRTKSLAERRCQKSVDNFRQLDYIFSNFQPNQEKKILEDKRGVKRNSFRENMLLLIPLNPLSYNTCNMYLYLTFLSALHTNNLTRKKGRLLSIYVHDFHCTCVNSFLFCPFCARPTQRLALCTISIYSCRLFSGGAKSSN